ncbi:MAG: DNA repair protein RecO [Verrucomicrobia bacterium]|nr:DNA repair protein RecO [Verrucomicrobiota bacterium]
MDERTAGIILRTRLLTETSLIVHWLTPDLGRLATVAKGARRLQSPFAGKLDLFFRADFSFIRSRRSDLHTLREVSVHDFNPVLRTNLAYLEQAAYFARLLELTTETETPLPAFYELLVGVLSFLPRQPLRNLTVYAFEAKLLQELGLAPDLSQCPLTPAAKAEFSRIAQADWSTLPEVALPEEQSVEIGRFLRGLIAFHFDRVPGGRPP